MEKVGLLSTGLQMDARSARAWVSEHFKGIAGQSAILKTDASLSWVELILRERPAIPFPAIRHLVIQAALASTSKPNAPTLDHKPTGRPCKSVSALDFSTAKALDQRIRTRLRTSARFTLQEEMEALQMWARFRHERWKYPEICKVIERHRPAMGFRRQPKGTHCRPIAAQSTAEQ